MQYLFLFYLVVQIKVLLTFKNICFRKHPIHYQQYFSAIKKVTVIFFFSWWKIVFDLPQIDVWFLTPCEQLLKCLSIKRVIDRQKNWRKVIFESDFNFYFHFIIIFSSKVFLKNAGDIFWTMYKRPTI